MEKIENQAEIEKPKILIVDDRPENLLSLEILFENEPYEIITALSGNEALAAIITHDFAVVLLDVQMPGMDGFETAELMRSNKKTAHIPIIFVTAISKEKKHIFKGYESGAVDYLFKPLDQDIIKNKISVFVDLYKQKKIIEIKNFQLSQANKAILKHQQSLVEEERLKVLLQMAGATAHELNQPLTILLGNIELLQTFKESPEKLAETLIVIAESGKRIAATVKRIQFIQRDYTKKYSEGAEIIDINPIKEILWVEDEDDSFTVLKKMLGRKHESNVTRAASIAEAKTLLSENEYDLAILDLNLPDGNSLELLNFLKKQELKLASIIVTGYGDEEIAARCIQAGAYGYLSKGNISIDLLDQGIEDAYKKFCLDKEMDKAVGRMAQMATRDELTGLYNRRYMIEFFDREYNRSNRYDSDLSCMVLDLDYFKQVNDTYGHACGDYVLKEFSNILIQNARGSDYAFRYGGEEFMVLLPQTDISDANIVAEKIRKLCEDKEYSFNDHTLKVTVSIGIASIKNCLTKKSQDLMALADKALYRAKADGRNSVKIYQSGE